MLLLQLFIDTIHFSIVNSNARHKSYYPRLPRLPKCALHIVDVQLVPAEYINEARNQQSQSFLAQSE